MILEYKVLVKLSTSCQQFSPTRTFFPNDPTEDTEEQHTPMNKLDFSYSNHIEMWRQMWFGINEKGIDRLQFW